MAEKDKLCRRFQGDGGDAELVTHRLFRGVELTYLSVHMDMLRYVGDYESVTVEINHCREGRLEHMVRDELFYLCPGDLSVTLGTADTCCRSFPLKHYHGICITLTDAAPDNFSEFLHGIDIRPYETARGLCEGGKSFVLRRDPRIEHIFSELYCVPEEYRQSYLRLKAAELLLVLSHASSVTNGICAVSVSQSGAELAKKVAEHLSLRLSERVTLDELSQHFHVSKTHLQNCFKSVYGVPICSYTRVLKMQAAGAVLTHTSRTVMDIACELGYSNASKFSAVFSQVMGEAPAEYRKHHTSSAKYAPMQP